MTIDVSFEQPNLVVMRVSGVLLRAEADAAKHAAHDHMQQNGRSSLLVLIEDGFGNFEKFASWEDIDVDVYLQQNVLSVAVVGDLRWRDSALLYFMTALAQFPIEYFKSGQETLARAWLEP